MEHYISDLINILTQMLAGGGYWALGFVVIIESLPIVGSLFPGHIAIISAGFLAKLGILNLGAVIAVSVVAAVIGDIGGFLLGRKYGYSFLQRFGKYVFMKEAHIEKGKQVIDNHTGKAIIFGKFSPVTRPLTPFMVGASGVNIQIFWFYNIVGAGLWVVSSIMLGYIFGASYHVAAQYFGKFLLAALISTILIIWGYRFVNIRFHIFKKYELFVLSLNLISLWILAKTIQDILSAHSPLVNFDVWINGFMLHNVTPAMASIASLVTNIGSTAVTGGLGLVIGIFFLFKRKWRRATIMLVSVVSAGVFLTTLKQVFMRIRPDDALKILNDPSFPSGHAGMAAAFFVAFAYIFAPKIESWVKREMFIVLCVLAVILIGLSRVVINVHWASDVIAGWSLGVFLATGSILLIRYVGGLFIKTDR